MGAVKDFLRGGREVLGMSNAREPVLRQLYMICKGLHISSGVWAIFWWLYRTTPRFGKLNSGRLSTHTSKMGL